MKTNRWIEIGALAAALGCAGCAGDDGGGDTNAATGAASETGDDGASSSPTGSAMTGMPMSGDDTDDDDGVPDDGAEDGDGTTESPADSTGAESDGSGDTVGDDNGSDTGVPVGCYDYDAFTPSTVSYRDDVMPILAARCSGCHANPNESVYYGMGGTTEAEATAIYDILLEGVPKQAPHLSFIVPGDPLRSYMMAKMEYDDPGGTCSEVQCREPGCNLQAPPAAQLPENELAVMRSWILGGALND